MAWEIETVFELDDESLFAEMVDNNIGLFLWNVIIDSEDPDYDQYQDNLVSYAVPEGATSLEQVLFDGSVTPIPVWEEVKIRFFEWIWVTHEAEFAAIKNNIGRTLISLFDETIEFGKLDKRWADAEIRSGEDKPTWAEIKAEEAIVTNVVNIAIVVAAAHKTMDDNLSTEILSVFGTLDRDSANAFAKSWELKKNNAAEYTTEGLVALEAIAGFAINDSLDTEQKIRDYYTEKCNQLIVFDKFRDNEIKTYLTAKAVAEA